MNQPVFYKNRKGSILYADEKAWLESAREALRAFVPDDDYEIDKAGFAIRINTDSRTFKWRMQVFFEFDTAMVAALRDLGGRGVYAYASGASLAPGMRERPGGTIEKRMAREDKPVAPTPMSATVGSDVPAMVTSAPTRQVPSRCAVPVPTAPRKAPPVPAHGARHARIETAELPVLAAVEPQAWSRHVRDWSIREFQRINRAIGGWRLPHAELRQLIRLGFFEDAETLIEDLRHERPESIGDLERYAVWLDHRRENHGGVLERVAITPGLLATPDLRCFVAQAHLVEGRPEQAAIVLAPLLTAAVPTGSTAIAFTVAAHCHHALGQLEEASIALEKAWPFLCKDDREACDWLREALPPLTAPQALPKAESSALPMPSSFAEPDCVAVVEAADKTAQQGHPLKAYFTLKAHLSVEEGTVPVFARLALARHALSVGQWDDARDVLVTLFDSNEALDDGDLSFVREQLVRDAGRRGDSTAVVRYAKGWYGSPDDADLLAILGQANEDVGHQEEARRFYLCALERGSEAPAVLRSLAHWAYDRFDDCCDPADADEVHERYSRLLAVPGYAFRPDDAADWLLALYQSGRAIDAEELARKLLDGLEYEQTGEWVDVYQHYLDVAREIGRSGEELALIAADHIQAAELAGRPAADLARMLVQALGRLTQPADRATLLEDVAAIDAPEVRSAVYDLAANLALATIEMPLPDATLLLRLFILVYATGGTEAYEALLESYEAKRNDLAKAGATLAELDGTSLLAGKRIALVGGQMPWLTSAEVELTRFFGADVTLVPPSWEENYNESTLANRLAGRDLVLVMWRCVKHSTTNMIRNLIERGVVDQNRIRPVPGTGGKCFVRAALATAA